jgi:hypothetical protein
MNSPRASAWATTLVKASNIEELLFSTSKSGRVKEETCDLLWAICFSDALERCLSGA